MALSLHNHISTRLLTHYEFNNHLTVDYERFYPFLYLSSRNTHDFFTVKHSDSNVGSSVESRSGFSSIFNTVDLTRLVALLLFVS